jgi:hypothetical protein
VIQPAAYYRYISMQDKVGTHKDYMCFKATGIKVMNRIFQGYLHCCNLGEHNINMSTSPGLSQLLSSSGVKDMMIQNEGVAHMIRSLNSSNSTEDKLNDLVAAVKKKTEIMTNLLMLLHTNAFVTAVVLDKVVPSAGTAISDTQSNVPVSLSDPTPQGRFEGTTVLVSTMATDDNTS